MSLPVFPGAQGFGTETPAGRGGRIIKVENLNDSGDGSLREALKTSGPRIILFEVGGTIRLADNLKIKEPFVTIAGQTAPSPGITLRGAGIVVNTHDVLIQHLRIRVGDEKQGPSPYNRDALTLAGSGAYNVVVDHISASWAIDENVSTWYGARDLTISHSIISEGLNRSRHKKGAHSKGLLIGDHSRNVAVIGNLLAHNVSRNPALKGGVTAVVLNNLIYNGDWAMMRINDGDDSGPIEASLVGNVFVDGPDTPENAHPVVVSDACPEGTKVHLSGNHHGRRKILMAKTSFDISASSPPVWHPSLRVRDRSVVKALVLTTSGARPNDRDAVDARIVRDVIRGSGRIIDSQQEVGGWPKDAPTHRRIMIPEDPHADPDGNGYSRIEEILHRMARELEI